MDFGFLTIVPDSATLSSYRQGGTAQWMSPELFDPQTRHTNHSDCYALGMVIYEVLSGHVPFPQCDGYAAIPKVVMGEHPVRPHGMKGVWFTDEVWEVCGNCWTTEPERRPSVEGVLQRLEEASGSWKPPSPKLSAVPLAAGPSTRRLSDMESTDGSVASSPSSVAPDHLSEEPGLEESAGTANRVGWASLLDEIRY